MGRTRTAIAWVLQVLIGFVIASGGVLKLAADPAMVDLFSELGAGQGLRVLVGALEVAGGVGLLIPRLRALAALGLTLLLLGAAVVNVTALGASPLMPLMLATAALAILALRRDELRRRPLEEPVRAPS
jgi:putative oxidoreductase